MSPLLFNLYINDLVALLHAHSCGILLSSNPSKKLAILLYADDIVLLAPNPIELQKSLDLVALFLSQKGLKLNPSKCGTFATSPSH